MTFVDHKARARRSVHAAFAVPCKYSPPANEFGAGGYGVDYDVSMDGPGSVVDLTVRLHDRLQVGGGTGDQPGYASLVEGVVHLTFNREELSTAGVELKRGGLVTVLDFNGTGQNVLLELDSRYPYDGPITEKWSVVPA